MEPKSFPLDRICNLNNDLQKFIVKSFMCKVCQNIPFPPVRLHKDSTDFYCKDCFSLYYENENSVLPSPFELGYLENLNFKCQLSSNGCSRFSNYKQLDTLLIHEKKCEYKKEKCPYEGCEDQILNIELNEHLDKCQFRKKTCEHCQKSLDFKEVHLCYEFLKFYYMRGTSLEKENQEIKSKLENVKAYYESKFIDIKKSYEDKISYLEKTNEFNENLLANVLDRSSLIEMKNKNHLSSFYQNKINSDINFYGENSLFLAKSLKQYGTFLFETKEFLKTIEILEKYQSIIHLNENTKIDYLDLAITNIYLGKSYFNLRNFHESIKKLENALLIYSEANQIEEKYDLASDSYNLLGYCYLYCKDYEKAISQFNSSLRLKIMKIGEISPEVANIYNNLGHVLKLKGEYEIAFENFSKAKEIRTELFGCKHASVAKINNNLGLICSDLQRHKESIDFFTEAFINFKNLYGLYSLEIANTLSNMSLEYYNTKQFSKALSYQNKCLLIKLNLLGEKNVDVAESYFILKDIHEALGNKSLEREFEDKFKKLKTYLGEVGDVNTQDSEEYEIDLIV